MTDDELLYNTWEAEDSTLFSLSTTTGAHNPSFGLVRHRTDNSIAEQSLSVIVNIESPWTGLSIVEFPTSISDTLPELDELFSLCRAPRQIHDDFMPFFLSYHRQK